MSLFRKTPDPDEIDVIGAPRTPLTDVYHQVLRAPWWLDLLGVSGVFLLINFLFALGYVAVGGVAGARPGSLADHFFFSVQTMGTIGYGVMHPQTAAAETLVTCEVIVGVSLVALTTGMLFAKFSVPRARMQFAASATISPFNGVPTLMFRLGNERASQVVEATVRVVLVRTERTAEGVVYYRMRDLVLKRDRSPVLARSWTVLHRIDESSPLHGATPETLERDEVELMLTVVGIDDTSAQNLHARHTYGHAQVRWGARHADMLSEAPRRRPAARHARVSPRGGHCGDADLSLPALTAVGLSLRGCQSGYEARRQIDSQDPAALTFRRDASWGWVFCTTEGEVHGHCRNH